MGIKETLFQGRAEVVYDGHTIAVESKTGRGVGNHHRLFVDGEAQDAETTFLGDHLDGTLPDGRTFKVRVEQGVRTHYHLLIGNEEIKMGSDFVA
ncbi:hypothetical protein [Streptosporangium longisporum]|uniref:Uncharacterized protein n=1 Tax=Streptosporangium longisporum TaxID=46187 RepID=A0ABN3Y6M8_9ACTN